MTVYHVSPELINERRGWDAAGLTIAAAALLALVEAIQHKPFDLESLLVFAVTFAATDYWWMPGAKAYDLEVDDDGMREISRESVRKVISSRKVRYVREWKRRKVLVVCEHAGLRMFLAAKRIEVPMSLPHYEQIKSQALQWLNTTTG